MSFAPCFRTRDVETNSGQPTKREAKVSEKTDETLNIYEVCPEHSPAGNDGYTYSLVWHVVAPSRGKARAEFASYWGFDFTDPMRIKLLEKGVDLPAGLDEDYRWARQHPEKYDDEWFEAIQYI